MTKFVQNIFSIKNENFYKVLRIFGIKIKFINTNKFLNELSDFKYKYYLQKSNIQAAAIHPRTFLPYKGINTRKEVVVVGCGPSLNYYKQIANAFHIGVNRAFLAPSIVLNALFMQDSLLGGGDMLKASNYKGAECVQFYGIIPENRLKQLRHVHKISNQDICNANARPYILEDACCGNFAQYLEIEPIGDFKGCIFSALQFALYTNPKKLYLVGCDCSDGGHFHQERIEVVNGSSLSYQRKSWEYFKEFSQKYYSNTEIVSINPVGLKGLFKDVYTQSYVDSHPELNLDNVEILNI